MRQFSGGDRFDPKFQVSSSTLKGGFMVWGLIFRADCNCLVKQAGRINLERHREILKDN